jgi:hypothetical protein
LCAGRVWSPSYDLRLAEIICSAMLAPPFAPSIYRRTLSIIYVTGLVMSLPRSYSPTPGRAPEKLPAR